MLLIIVDGQGELSGSYTVTRSGTILMPLIQRVRALDRTPGELEQEITERLAKDYIVDPKVSVGVREYNSRRVYLMLGDGAVVSVPLGPKSLLSELLLQSGVPAKVFVDGEAKVTRTVRQKAGAPPVAQVVAEVPLAALMLKGDLKQDVRLKPGDVIRIPVPESRFVYLLVGEEPAASVPLEDKDTLRKLLLSVKLPSRLYSSGEATVTRTKTDKPGDPPHAEVVATVDLRKLMVENDLSVDCTLEGGDLIRIPSKDSRSVYLMVGEAPVVSRELGPKGTLSELLLDAELPAAVFSHGQATVSRAKPAEGDGPGQATAAAEVELAALMLKHDVKQDVALQPGDIIRIALSQRFVYLLVNRETYRNTRGYTPGYERGRSSRSRVPLEEDQDVARERFEKIKHPLGDVGTLSSVLLDANIEPELFERCVAIVTRVEAQEAQAGAASEITTSAVADLSDLMLDGDRSQDVDLVPNDLIYVVQRRKARYQGYVYILGAVKKPGAYKCRRNLDVRDVIKEAGGYLPTVDSAGLIITRATSKNGRGERFGTYSLSKGRSLCPELLLDTGDSAYVPAPASAKRDAAVLVLGSVARPGRIPFEKGMCLGDVIAKAGGCNGLGSLGKLVVKRPGPDGVRTVACVLRGALDKRAGGKGPLLEPGDIVVVHP